jgi:hypothetical protein
MQDSNIFFDGWPKLGRSLVLAVLAYGALVCRAAEERYGKGSRPASIILTHGHFDHSAKGKVTAGARGRHTVGRNHV